MKKSVLYLAFVYLAAMISIWTVKSATPDGRWYATMLMVLIGFAIVVAVAIVQVGPKETRDANPTKGPHHLFGAMTGVFIASILLASAFTHARPGVGPVGSLGSLLGSIGSAIFPVVGKYATMMQLGAQTLFKTQAVMTIFLLGGFLNGCLLVAAILILPRQERQNRFSDLGERSSRITSALAILFFIFLIVQAYFGWSEFDENAREMSLDAKGCAVEAFCYLRGSDLMLFSVAALKSFLIGLFPILCAFSVVWFFENA